MPDDLRIETLDTGAVRVVRISGRLFLPGTAPLMTALTSALTAAPHRVAVCDLSALDAPLTDALLTAFPAALRRGGGWPHASLHLAAPSPALAARLTWMRMSRYLPVHAHLEDAVDAAALETSGTVRRLTLDPDARSLRVVREAVTGLWPPTAGTGPDEATLVVNELAANAIRHVAEPFTVSLAVAPSRALVAVTDPSRDEPVLRPPRPPSATGGRGMHVVAALSRDWGVRLVHPRGKTVWAQLPGPTPPAVPRTRSRRGA